MLILKIVIKNTIVSRWNSLLALPFLAASLLLLAFAARGAAYYSTGAPVVATPAQACPLGICGGPGISIATNGALLNGLPLAATVYVPSSGGPARLRLRLTGTAPAGYRAGMLLSAVSAQLGLSALGATTLRTYLSTGPAPEVAQETQLVALAPAQLQLLAAGGPPVQVEFVTKKPFDQVELELANVSILNLGVGVNVHYAYGIGPNMATPVPGYVSRFSSPASHYADTGCASTANPERAADADLTNYATFSSLATINCPNMLRVALEGTAPATYRAGFVIGNTGNLLDADILGGLVLRTYDAASNLLETSAVSPELLSLTALPDGKSLVSFPASQPFSAVSIEQNGVVTALNSLQLYYGVGVAPAGAAPQVLSKFSSGAGHNKTASMGVCVGCNGVSGADNASGPNLNAAATVQVGLGVANSTTLQLDLNATGQAGNRAGVVIGNNSLLDADLLKNSTLATYDAAGNVLESATGAALLALNVLPDGRKMLTFNTTKNFNKVSLTVGGLASVVSTTDVYYAFADNSNGTLLIAPPSPLPVSLVSFGVRRLAGAGAAEVNWTTASELHSASFVVERSAAPADGFAVVGEVAATGNSTAAHYYTLRDAEAASQPGLLYYRLRQVEASGQATVSGVVVLAAAARDASVSFFPNPVSPAASSLTVRSSAALAPGSSVSIYSGVGQLLSYAVVSAPGGTTDVAVPTAGLAAGLYQVVLRNAAGQPLASRQVAVIGH